MKQNSASTQTTFWARQSFAGKLAISLFVWPAIAGIFIALLFSNIIPNPNLMQFEIALSIVYAILWSIFLEIANHGRVWDPKQKGYKMLSKRWLRIPFMLCIGFMFGYSSFVWAYPWLFTNMAGTMKSMDFVVTGWDSGGRRGCSRPKIGHALFQDSPGALCVNEDAYKQMPPGTHLRIVGPQTFLGINTEKMYIVKLSTKQNTHPKQQQNDLGIGINADKIYKRRSSQ